MKFVALGLLPACLAVACGGNSELGFDQSISAAVVAGTDATITAHNVPASLAPGESRIIDVTVQNSGTVAWENSDYAIRPATAAGLPFTARVVTAQVNAGASTTFRIYLTAPSTDGAYTFNARMYLGRRTNGGYFGTTLTVPVQVSSQTVGQLHSQLISHTIPATMAPNERRNVNITLRNIGYELWTTTQVDLRSSGTVRGSRARAASNISTGQDAVFPVQLTAPATNGAHSVIVRLHYADGTLTGPFGVNVTVPVNVVTPTAYDSVIVSHTIPTDMASNFSQNISVTVRNTGVQAWSGASFALVSQNGMWMTSSVPLAANESVAAGATKVFNFSITSPVSPGSYQNDWRMAQNGAPFGATASQNTRIMTLENGSFETGNYANWHFQSTYDGACSTFGVATQGTVLRSTDMIMDYYENVVDSQSSPGLPMTVAATDGTRGGFLLVECPDQHVLYQDVTVPSCNAQLSLDLGWNSHIAFQAGQELALEVRNAATDSVLSTLFVTNGSTPRTAPLSAHSYDISAFAGSTVRLALRVNAQMYFIETSFDDFSVDCF